MTLSITYIKQNYVQVQPGEPVFVNLNSFETITEVLRTLGRNAGIKPFGKGERERLFVKCDGQPYTVMRKLIDILWKCPNCGISFYGINAFQEHFCHSLRKCKGMTKNNKQSLQAGKLRRNLFHSSIRNATPSTKRFFTGRCLIRFVTLYIFCTKK